MASSFPPALRLRPRLRVALHRRAAGANDGIDGLRRRILRRPHLRVRNEDDLAPSQHLKVVLGGEYDDVDLPQGDFITRLATLNLDVAFNTAWSWENFIQYDNVSDTVGVNSILRWIPRAGRETVLAVNSQQEDFDRDGNFRSYTSDLTLEAELHVPVLNRRRSGQHVHPLRAALPHGLADTVPAGPKGVAHVFMAGIDGESPELVEAHGFARREHVFAGRIVPVSLTSPSPLAAAVPRLDSLTLSITTARPLVFVIVTRNWLWSWTVMPPLSSVVSGWKRGLPARIAARRD